ncbi:MarR family winged helix-turn-helix transcriptional regulator [Mammaliicoccus sp. Dog046]|uniref:MarR family winged helix-turn-helix transcriptional regulator n=1 Tax=Mammaliicoccus sp. Dog046 TaxID=3034233 RepID=UPI002B25ADD6|nr:SMC-Scp complex subunit ScpB [Mammaliicoccus sp. Dog046]WQK85916.1 SMC-Scp complex subunit ScpB [Mammaliicoccus sp. Dog046]
MENFLFTYTNLYRPYIHHINKILEAYDLYTAQYKVLHDIAYNQPTTLVHVSKRSFIEKPTARKIIKKLIEHQLVQAVNSQEDKREKFLTLTEKGQLQFDEIHKKIKDFQNQSLEAVDASEQEIEQAQRLLKKLRKHLIEEETES